MMPCRDHITTWDQVLPMAEFAYNNSVNRSTCFSPFEALTITGVRSRLPIDLVPYLLQRALVLKHITSSNTCNRYMMKFDVISPLAMTVTRLMRTNVVVSSSFLKETWLWFVAILKGYHQELIRSCIHVMQVHSKS